MTPLGGPLWQIDDTWYGNATDDYGVEWWVDAEAVDGWYSSPAIRGDGGDLPGGDGGVDSNPLYSPRVISLSGTAIAPTAALALAARTRFSSLLDASRGGVLTVTENGQALSCVVRPSGPFRADAPLGGQAFGFQMQLTAPDPRKYGPAVEVATGLSGSTGGLVFPMSFPLDFGSSAGGSVALVNDGTVKSWPVLRINGPVSNPRILNPVNGDQLRIGLTLGIGDYLDIDTSARTVLLQGTASRRGAVSATGEWLPVPPGGASFTFGGDTYEAAASLTVSARSAWI